MDDGVQGVGGHYLRGLMMSVLVGSNKSGARIPLSPTGIHQLSLRKGKYHDYIYKTAEISHRKQAQNMKKRDAIPTSSGQSAYMVEKHYDSGALSLLVDS